MTSRFRDFDAAFDELGEIEFVVGGTKFNIGQGPPAAKILKAVRDGIAHENRALEMLNLLLGEETAQQVLDTGIEVGKLTELVEWLMLQIDARPPSGEGTEGGEASGNSSTPKRSLTSSR